MTQKRVLSIALLLCMLLSVLALPGAVPAAEAATVDTADTSANTTLAETSATSNGLASSIWQGQILQAWCWSYKNIINNLPKIADQGFTAIQVSPIQPIKESTTEYWCSLMNSSWIIYQPVAFNIETNYWNAQGTKAEFRSMCNQAHKYGIKIIVDVVFNHTANDMSGNTIHPWVPSDLRDNPDCWHDISKNTYNYDDRYEVTQYCMMGLPDLNTANSTVQWHCKNLLKEAIYAGADGFRFDAAKHIETPWDSYCGSNFWPNVLNEATSYAQSTRGITPYYYGEVLGSPGGGLSINAYTQYMSVSDPGASDSIRDGVCNGNASKAAAGGTGNGAAQDKVVQWTESHDNHKDSGTRFISEHNINKTWALLGSKANIVALYLARPYNMDTTKMGDADRTSWTAPAVKAVNRFKNHFEGQSEYLSSYYNLACVERGDSGMIIVNTGGSYYNDMSAPVHTMMDGTYKDAITGNTFTVSNGWIHGDIGDTGIAVVYHGNNAGIFTPGKQTTFSLCGSFNSWDNTNNVFLADTSSTASTTISLKSGTYSFKLCSDDVWYGNTGTFTDTTDSNGYSNPWEFSVNVSEDCTLKASGGRYKFIYDAPNRSLEVKRVSSSATCNSPYYLKGDFNGWGTGNQMRYIDGANAVIATLDLDPGTYAFKLNNSDAGIWFGNPGTIVDTTTNTSLVGWEMEPSNSVSNCTLKITKSGTFTFMFDLSTRMLVIHNSASATATFVDWDGTVLKTETVDAGVTPTAPASPTRTGYTFTGWSPSIGAITKDTTYTAQYTINTFGVTASSSPAAGGTTTASASTVNYGGEVTLKAAPNTGDKYSFTNWQITGSYTIVSGSLGSASVTIKPSSAITATANYTQAATYTVSKSSGTGGSASASANSVVQGNTVTLSATPSKGYTFSGWSISGSYTAVSGSTTSKSFTIKPSSNITVKANFSGNQSTIKFATSTGGSVTNNSSAAVTYPNSRSSTATASTGYKFTSWVVSGGTEGTDYEITSGSTTSATISIRPITAGKTITATASFTGINATVKFTAGTGGSVTNAGSNEITYPATKTSAATASTGYTFSGWTVSGGTQNTDYKITAGGGTNSSITIQPLTAGKTITATANFTQKSYTVTFKNYDGTVISTQSVKHGSAASAPEDPVRSGYVFTGWDQDFSSVTSAMTVTAQYASDVVYILGDFNNWDMTRGLMTKKSGDIVTKTYTLDAGTYEFKINRAGTWYGNWGTIEDTTVTTSSIGWEMSEGAANCVLKTTGGTYIFNYNKSTRMLEVLRSTPSYTVTFNNYNGVTLKTETVQEGKSATAPTAPTRPSTAQYDYVFTGWDTDFSNIQSDLIVTAQFTATVRQYTVTFVNYDGSTIATQKVNYGAAATAPSVTPVRPATAQYSYTFKAWDKSFTKITADTTVTATYNQTLNKYTVTFKNYDGSVLSTQQVEYGSAATAPKDPTRPADSQNTYTFAGWDKNFSNITGNLTVTAVFTATSKNYTVTFKDYDGTVLSTQSVSPGSSATAPAAPTRESDEQYNYTFSGWDKSFTNVTGDLTVTAQYSKELVEYYVVFLDYYGDILSEQLVPYGSSAVAPEVPDVIDGGYRYVFAEWDTDYTNIQADTPVFAIYDEEALTYTVTFKNYDGTVLKTQKVAQGASATAPATPTRPSTAQYTYTFKGWDKSFTKVNEDITVTATFTANVRKYTVTFKNYDGTVLSTQQVEYGNSATAPKDPTREGCIFKGWDIDFSKVTSNLTVTAMFVDDTLYLLGDFNDWTVANATPLVFAGDGAYSTSLSLDEGTYEFKVIHSGVWLGNWGTIEDTTTATSEIGWEMLEGANNCTLKASGGIYHFYYHKDTKMLEILHEIPEYVVTFANYDGSVIDTQSVAEGEAAVEPEIPTRSASAQYTYSFRSWDRSFDCITEDTLVTAQYSRSINEYTVTFKDYDGTVLSTQQVEYGSAAVAPKDPTRTNYVFTGWNTYFGFIVADTIVVAQYADARTYLTGDFNNWNENTVMTKGSGVVVSTTMELPKGKYEFKIKNRDVWYGNTGVIEDTTLATSSVGWEMVSGAGNCTLNASGGTYTFNFNTSTNMLEVIYKSSSFIVTFVDYNGTILKTQAVKAGGAATAPTAPTRDSDAQFTYTFKGWDKSFANIQADTTVTATYNSTVRKYTVKFLNHDGSVLSTQVVEYGSSAVAPETPARAATAQYTYTFAGWDKSYDLITQNVNITATYSADVNEYTVTFEDYDGTVLSTQQVEYGTAAVAPKAPAREGDGHYTYTFKGWDKDFSSVTSNLVVKATYNQNAVKYTVVFQNFDGTVLASQKVEHGTAATAPANPTRTGNAQYTYTFKGWDTDFSSVTKDLVIKAEYTATVNTFTVVFLDMDGEVISEQTVEYGKSATAPAAPAVAGYVFTGWDTDFSEITSETVVFAEYEEINVYLAGEFNDWDTKNALPIDSDGVAEKTLVLEAGTYEFKVLAGNVWLGNPYTVEDTTTNTSETGWKMTDTSVNCTLNATGGTYTFKFDTATNMLKIFHTASTYTVKFTDYNGTVLSTQTVAKGQSAKAPADPVRSGYTFIGWDTDFSNVTSDLTVTAKYSKDAVLYTVTFKDYDGTVLKTQQVEAGKEAQAPANPTRTGYTFTKWDKSFTNVTANLTVTAVYTKNQYQLAVNATTGGTVAGTGTYGYGDKVTIKATPNVGYTFTKWVVSAGSAVANATDATTTITVTANTIVSAQFSVKKYTVTFMNWDGTVIDEVIVNHGDCAQAPTVPAREGYYFSGWNKALSNITENTTVTALYDKQITEYTVTFRNYNGTVLKTETVLAGESATAPEAPTRASNAQYSYTFAGWDTDFSNVTSDLTVTAQFSRTANMYTVTFKDMYGDVIKTQQVAYGKSATAPFAPAVEGYTFNAWDRSCHYVTGNITVNATYVRNLYQLTVNAATGGTVAGTGTYGYGEKVTIKATPNEGYAFTKWVVSAGSAVANATDATTTITVTANTTVSAQFSLKKYTVTFMNWDGTVIDEVIVNHGDCAQAPTAPARAGYTFKAWDKDFSNITENMNVTALYTENKPVVIPTGSLRVRVTGGTGFTISVDGGNARPQGANYYNSKLPLGATVTITANAVSTNNASGTRFIGWMNPTTGEIVSTQAEYTFVVTGNDSLNAVFSIGVEGAQMVTFKNDKSNRILDSQYYGAQDSIEFPDAPTQVGFDFAGWSMTEAQIQSAIANGQDVEVVANWTRAIVPVKVTVNGGTGSGSYNANSAVTVVANAAPAGQKFAYWTDSKGNIKSYNAEYKFFPSTDTEVNAVFVAQDAVIDYEIIVNIDSIDTTTIADKNVFYFSWYCPEEFTFVKSGILAVNKDNYNESTFVAGTSDSNVYDRSPSGTGKAVNSTSWTKSNVTSGQTWRAMAYVQYRDAQGNIITVYSDTVEATK